MAIPRTAVSAMTIAGLTAGAPYNTGSARISTYHTTPFPRRLASWKIRRGNVREAPRFSLRHSPYSAASTRAMNVLNPVAFMRPRFLQETAHEWRVQHRAAPRQSHEGNVKVLLLQ